jgi:hypothetical protein
MGEFGATSRLSSPHGRTTRLAFVCSHCHVVQHPRLVKLLRKSWTTEHGQRPLLVIHERTGRARVETRDVGLCRGPLSSKKRYRRRRQGEVHDERELSRGACGFVLIIFLKI